MGYEAICDCCDKLLPHGETLIPFYIGGALDPQEIAFTSGFGLVCSDCHNLLYNRLNELANRIKVEARKKRING